MAIVSSDIKFKFSVAAAAGNTTSGTAAGSLGDQISTTEVPDATLHALFDKVDSVENAASDVEYRCIFVHNAHGSLTLTDPVVWLQAEVAGGANIEIAIDDITQSVIGSSSPQADTIANENTAPGAGVGTFSAPTSKGAGLSLGDLDAGKCRAIWIKRTATASAALAADGVTIRVEGDTAA